MKSYYGPTFFGIAVVFVASAAAAVFANMAAGQAKHRHADVIAENQMIVARQAVLRGQVQQLEEAMQPVRGFARSWQTAATVSRANAAERIPIDLESIAQRQLGLTADRVLTPPPSKHTFAGSAVDAQRVTLRASGRDLTQLLTWLGAVEEKYPAACIETCEFSPAFGGITGLMVCLVQPVERIAGAAPDRFGADLAALPPLIAATAWTKYEPAIVKRAVPVTVARNPLQPAMPPQQQLTAREPRNEDEFAPQIRAALTGHLRSVVRGAIPLLDVEGRILRIGDELLLAPREQPMRGVHIRLKQIGGAVLVFHISGGTGETPIDRDVPYLLPGFFKAR